MSNKCLHLLELYKIYRNNQLIITETPITSKSFYDSGLTNGTEYD